MPRYQSYLLRVWCSSRQDRLRQWTARLEGLQDGQHLQFTDLENLLAGLRAVLAADALDGSTTGEGAAPGDPLPDQHHPTTIVKPRPAERND